jgi:hypothetical protein
MYITYRSYRYSPTATFVSGLGSCLVVFLAIAALACIFTCDQHWFLLPLGAVFAAGAVCSWIFIRNKLSQKIADKNSEKNIRTKAMYAYMFCEEHPEAFEELAAQNPAFAAKYTKDENGKIVKIKKK